MFHAIRGPWHSDKLIFQEKITHFVIFSKSIAVFASSEYRFLTLVLRLRAGLEPCDRRLLVL
jgi:hypothetical protein